MTENKKPERSINKKTLNKDGKIEEENQKIFNKVVNKKVVDKRLLMKDYQ